MRGDAREEICDKIMYDTNHGPEDRSYDDILLIASYKDQNKGSLLCQDSTFNVYASIGIGKI